MKKELAEYENELHELFAYNLDLLTEERLQMLLEQARAQYSNL